MPIENSEPSDSVPDAGSEASKLSAGVPYLMSLLSLAMLGFVFVVLNGERVLRLVGAESLLPNPAEAKASALPTSVELVASKGLMFALAVTIPIGFLVQQFAGALSLLSARFFQMVMGWDCFSPEVCLRNLKDETLRLISECGSANYEWQWEYFNYCQYWGLLANALCFVALHADSDFIHDGWEWWQYALLSAGLGWLWLQAANRSRITLKIHNVCIGRAGKNRDIKHIPSRKM